VLLLSLVEEDCALCLTVVECLKVVDQSEDVGMTDRDATENSNLIPDHVLLALHQLLVDHLDGVPLLGLNLL